MEDWESIPGETPIDPSGLRDRSIRTRRQLNEAESRNIADVVYKYLIGTPTAAMAPFDLAWSIALHGEMFGKVWEWAGEIRTSDLNIGVPWHQVEMQLYNLFQNLPFWRDLSPIEQAARLHQGAVSIHPFHNGNGRWSRMLANIWLKLHAVGPTVWPEETIGQTSIIRDEYLTAIQAADRMDFAPLIALHQRFAFDESMAG